MFLYSKQDKKDIVQKKESEKPAAALNRTGIPDNIKTHFENLSGYSFDDVRIHYNSEKPAQLQALAYTQGNQVHIAPGQERHLSHELGHVVQQKQGRVQATAHVDGLKINDNAGMENEAARMGDCGGVINQITPGIGARFSAAAQSCAPFQFVKIKESITPKPSPPTPVITESVKIPPAPETDESAQPIPRISAGHTAALPELDKPSDKDVKTQIAELIPSAMSAGIDLVAKMNELNRRFADRLDSNHQSRSAAIDALRNVGITAAASIESNKKIVEFAEAEHNADVLDYDNIAEITKNTAERLTVLDYIKEDYDIHVSFIEKLDLVEVRSGTPPAPSAAVASFADQARAAMSYTGVPIKLTNEYKRQAAERFTHGTKKMRISYNDALTAGDPKSMYNTFSKSGTAVDTAFYSHITKQITIDPERDTHTPGGTDLTMTQRHGGGATTFHEMGHYVDFNLKSGWYNADELKNKLEAGYQAFANSIAIPAGLDKKAAITAELKKLEMDDVSDIVDGLTHDTADHVMGEFGHFAYWDNENALQNETVAHMFEARFEGTKKAAFKRVFRAAYQYLKQQYIKALLEKHSKKAKQIQDSNEWLKKTADKRKPAAAPPPAAPAATAAAAPPTTSE